jgi:hypothetical protein
MSKRGQENLIAGMFLCVFAGAFMMSGYYPPRARLIPVPLAIVGLCLAASQLLSQNLRKSGEGSDPTEATSPVRVGVQRECAGLAMVVGLLGAFVALGPLAATFLFTAAYFGFSNHYSVPKAVIYSAVYTLLLYLLFSIVLQIDFDRGLLGQAIGGS